MSAMPKQLNKSQYGFDESELAELFGIIKARSFKTGDFTLASGKQSALYFDLKPTIMSSRGNYLAARAFLARAIAERAEFVGGLAMGAVPIISSVAGLSEYLGAPIEAFFVRPKPKEHGTKLRVEGLGPGQSLVGRRVVMADDVTTTGGSVWEAIDAARQAGAVVDIAITLVDREEGAEAFLKERGVTLVPIFTATEFVNAR